MNIKMIKKQRLFYIYIIVFIIIVNALSKSVFPRDDTQPNDSTEVIKTEGAPANSETKTAVQPVNPEPTNAVSNTDTQPEKPQPSNQANPEATNPEGTNQEGTNPEGTNPEGTNPEGTNPGINPDNNANNTTVPIDNTEPQTDDSHKKSKDIRKSKVTSVYGSIEIEYIPIPEADKTALYRLHLIIYFSSIFGILVLVCLIHSLVYIRPKVIAKRANKRKDKKLKNKKESSLSNIDSNIDFNENNSDAKLQEGKIGNESPAGKNW